MDGWSGGLGDGGRWTADRTGPGATASAEDDKHVPRLSGKVARCTLPGAKGDGVHHTYPLRES